MRDLEALLARMLGPRGAADDWLPVLDPAPLLERSSQSTAGATAALTGTFLLSLRGREQTASAHSLERLSDFYRAGLERIGGEIRRAAEDNSDFVRTLRTASEGTVDAGDRVAAAEALWSVFFPEGVGILGHETERVEELRDRRTVTISALNRRPIADPAREVLFTSNVLLTVPAAGTEIDALPYPAELRRQLARAAHEPQLRWYDHPIQIGVEPAANELLYGLRGLDQAAAFERRHGRLSRRLQVVLSVSVTHEGLVGLAHDYVAEELARSGGFDNLEVHVFSESDCRRLVDEVLGPAAGGNAQAELTTVLGVDGEYGRHYSFLKAIAALWAVLVDPAIRATFKIDLDQVFPQDVLVAETGRSAFEHLMSPLWGACGIDQRGEEVELAMIAGALVNERDIGRGLFTPDVDFPAGPATPDEYVFFSRLPQALSTRAEMMARCDRPELDGRRRCLERVHVTGGTNGILVDALRRHRPFTPTFFGRAEDQAYVLSTLASDGGPPARLTYAHAAGLIMRHDKEAFASEAIEAARSGKLVGDDVRILYFSAYAELLGLERIKALTDPFTGCFISRLPQTVVLLRFALRLAHAFERGDERLVVDLAEVGVPRITAALDFTTDERALAERVAHERDGWTAYYHALEALEAGLERGDGVARRLREAARQIVAKTRVSREL